MLLKDLSIEKQTEIKNLEFNNIKPKKDITGNVYSHLTVLGQGPIYISPQGKTNTQWWCICDCPEHNIILVRISNLTSGNTKSCGCHRKQIGKEHYTRLGHAAAKDITNQHFGELTALEPTDKRNGSSIVWKCKCSCGNIYYVACNELNAGRITHCGCKRYESKGIRLISQLLDKNNIQYIKEKTYSNFKFQDTNGTPRFDFFINNTFLLEYDGEQHFQERDLTYFRDSLEKRQSHDRIKNQWCKDNNIPLKRITYKDLNNLTIDDIMGDKYLV